MAITIIQSPQSMMPAYNDIVFTVDSTNKAECNFKYICDIYVSGVYSTRLKLYPTGTDGYGSFMVNRVIEDYLSYDLNINNTSFKRNPNSVLTYQLKFGEEYDNSVACSDGSTVYDDLTVTTAYYAWNASFQYKDWKFYDDAQYYMSTSGFGSWLTDAPSTLLCRLDDQMNVNVHSFDDTTMKFALVTVTSNSGAVTSGKFVNPYYSQSSMGDHLLSVATGPKNINAATLTTGTQPLITSSTKYYTVQLLDNSSNPISARLKVNIDSRCTKYTSTRLWWLNRLGGFDSYTFSLKDQKKISIKRNEYETTFGSLDTAPTPDAWTYDLGDRGRTVMSVEAQESNTYTSNWMSEEESVWMQGLFTSPEVYVVQGNVPQSFDKISIATGAHSSQYLRFVLSDYTSGNITVGDTVTVDLSSTIFAGEGSSFTVTEVTNKYITVGPLVSGYLVDEYEYAGTLETTSLRESLIPVVITSNEYAEKVGYRQKNILYTIEVQKATGVNIQRN